MILLYVLSPATPSAAPILYPALINACCIGIIRFFIAFHVVSSTIPVALIPLLVWNFFTAFSVPAPKIPSVPFGLMQSILNPCWTYFTEFPLSPFFKYISSFLLFFFCVRNNKKEKHI